MVEFNVAGSNSWVADFTGDALIQCWGAGGGGGAGLGLTRGGSGGGGGAYAQSTITVTQGTSYDITVGAGGTGSPYNQTANTSGSDTSFALSGSNLVLAKAGLRSTGTTTNAGAGGSDVNSIGDVKNPGFTGSVGLSSSQVGGAGGAGALPHGGLGGAGGNNSGGGNAAGQPGNFPGGGGGGGDARTGGTGGAGAPGTVRVSYFLTLGSRVINGELNHLVSILYNDTGVIREITPYRIDAGVKKLIARLRKDLSVTLRTPPPYLAVGTESLFDVTNGTFNLNAPNLMSAIAANDAQVVIVSDSVGEGWTYLNHLPPYDAEADFLHAWPLMMRDYITENAGINLGGTGVVRASTISGVTDPRWALTGWTKEGHYIRTTTQNNLATFTADQDGTAVAVLTARDSVEVTIDDVVVGVTAPTAEGVVLRTEYTGLTNTKHIVKLRRLAGSPIVLGVDVYVPNSGIRIHNLSQGGAAATGTGQPAWADSSLGAPGNMLPTYSQAAMYDRRPDAVFIGLGGNDMHQGATGAQIRAAFDIIAATFAHPDTDIILLPAAHASELFIADAYNKCIPMWQELLDSSVDNGYSYVDFEWLTGGFPGLSGLGYTGDAFGHLNVEGAKYLGKLASNIFAPPPA